MDTAQLMVAERGDFVLVRPGTFHKVITLESSVVLHGEMLCISTLHDTMLSVRLDDQLHMSGALTWDEVDHRFHLEDLILAGLVHESSPDRNLCDGRLKKMLDMCRNEIEGKRKSGRSTNQHTNVSGHTQLEKESTRSNVGSFNYDWIASCTDAQIFEQVRWLRNYLRGFSPDVQHISKILRLDLSKIFEMLMEHMACREKYLCLEVQPKKEAERVSGEKKRKLRSPAR